MVYNYQGTGKKLRRQYINGILFYFYSIMLGVPIVVLILDEVEKLNIFDFLSILPLYGYLFLFTSPLLLLSILNRNFFGEVVCIVDENGIYYEKRFVPWDRIVEIQYEIVLPSKRRKVNPFKPYEIHACHAYVIGTDCKFKIMYAPHYILQIVKRYNRNIKAGFSKESKKIIAVALCLPFLVLMLSCLRHVI